jgi:1-acyl-sn-glycerol-3-phosphate acyltransferase
MKRPNPFLYLPFAFLLTIFAFFKGQRIYRHVKMDKPAIVIANHTSFYDFIYSTTALFPKRVTYVAVDKMFYTQPAGFFMRLARAIPKCLFQPDLRSTKNILQILKKKGVVCLYPEGQISSYGETLDIPFQIAKLIKVANVNLYMCKHQGAYFSNPPWTKRSFKGRIQTDVFELITKSELNQLDENSIYHIIKEKMYYNASKDNQIKKVKYAIKDLSNFENVIYQCPACFEKTIVSSQDKLICESCQKTYQLDEYGQLDNRLISDFYHFQEQHMIENLNKDSNFTLHSKVDLESYHHGKIQVIGSGQLTLNQTGYSYKGTMLNESVELTFDPKHIPTLPSDIGINIQIYKDYRLYQFVIKDEKKLTMQFVILGEILHKLSKAPMNERKQI